MRKRCTRTIRTARPPMLVVMQTVSSLEIAERSAIEAFRTGSATVNEYDNLADCRDLLMLACAEGHDQSAKNACEVGLITLQNIRIRHHETGRFGCTGDELQALVLLVDYSRDYWTRQPGSRFAEAYDALVRARKMQAHERMAA